MSSDFGEEEISDQEDESMELSRLPHSETEDEGEEFEIFEFSSHVFRRQPLTTKIRSMSHAELNAIKTAAKTIEKNVGFPYIRHLTV